MGALSQRFWPFRERWLEAALPAAGPLPHRLPPGALEKKVQAHNSLAERAELLEEKLKASSRRIQDLEHRA